MTPNFKTVLFLAVVCAASSFALSADGDDSLSIAELNTLIDGPPAPEAPAVMTRDDDGNATLRAVRLEEPLVLDGSLDERAYASVPAMSGFVATTSTSRARTRASPSFSIPSTTTAAGSCSVRIRSARSGTAK